MDAFDEAIGLLPVRLARAIDRERCSFAEEIRLRIGCPPTVLTDGVELPFSAQPVTERELYAVLERATGASVHSAAAQMSEGYVYFRGLRIGICGTAVERPGAPMGFKSFSSLSIRIPRDLKGICSEAVEKVCCGGYKSTLVLSPPGGGKTTALRDMIRQLSDRGYRVSVLDERSELAGTQANGQSLPLGAHSDILTGVDKERGAMMLLRGMNPQIIAMDEITKPGDIRTIMTIDGCGVMLLASAHAASFRELSRRAAYRELLEHCVFTYFVEISGLGSSRRYTVRKVPEA